MTIEVSPDIERRLINNASAEGLSPNAYVERLISEEDSRRTKLEAFQQAIAARVAELDCGEYADGEAVMDQLIADLDGYEQCRK